MSSIDVVFNLSVMILVVLIGDQLSNEASRTSSIFIKSIVANDALYHQKVDSIHCLAQIQGRKPAVQNFLFKIDWKVFVAVSLIKFLLTLI